MPFNPAVREQRFVLDHVAQLADLAASERFADATPDLVDAVLEGAGAFAAGEWAPLARAGDTDGPKWTPEGVKMPAGYPEAYRAYVDGGWGTIGAPGDFGGQGLPFVLASAVLETLGAANMGFALAPTLTVGDHIGDHGRPIEVLRRRINQRAVQVDRHRALSGRDIGRDHRQRIAVDVAIVS